MKATIAIGLLWLMAMNAAFSAHTVTVGEKDFLLDRNPLQIRCGEIQGWKKCVRPSNGVIELIATLHVGPWIIRFGFVGGENQFCEFVEQMGKTDGEVRRAYGGHIWKGNT
jgi:hypothetical protein